MDKNKIYDELYTKYSNRSLDEHKIIKILKFLDDKRFDSFLDIGCGDGCLTEVIAKKICAKNVCGIDISKEAVMTAKARGINAVTADIDKDDFPFKGNSFDFIFCGDVIEHVFDADRLVEFVHWALKPGGRVLIVTPNLAAWHARIFLLFGYNPFTCSVSFKNHGAGKPFLLSSGNSTEHIRFFTLKALCDLFKINNFIVNKKFAFYSPTPKSLPLPIYLFVDMADRLFSIFKSFSSIIGIYAKKCDYK
ncbi:MAG: class I SAM-dependent methyltransferase [Endomicrobiales bacterium]|nr:class I SAM-dependent methyltransferase [Endomicrobiales bacterium]